MHRAPARPMKYFSAECTQALEALVLTSQQCLHSNLMATAKT